MKNKKSKGLAMPEEVGMTLVLIVVAMIMIVLVVFTYIQVRLPVLSSGKPVAYSIDFVSIANMPFMLAEVLTQIKLGDRQLLEQSIESSVAGGLEEASATGLPANISYLMNTFGLRNYRISIIRDNREIITVDNTENKCGDNKEGWCVFGDCDVGRVAIAPGKNICPLGDLENKGQAAWTKCCKEDRQAYATTVNKYRVIGCANEKGVCSAGVRPLEPDLASLQLFAPRPYCTQNRIDLGLATECVGVNDGKTRVCCAPKTEANEIELQTLTRAAVPLLYKVQVYGTLEVTGI